MTTPFQLTVFGEPAPQGSKIAHALPGGKIVMREVSKKIDPWRGAVKMAVLNLVGDDFEPFDAPLEIETTFFLKRGSTIRRPLPAVAPDLDKLERGLFDALTGAGVWRDDSLVVSSISKKVYADTREPGADVTIRVVDYIPLAIL